MTYDYHNMSIVYKKKLFRYRLNIKVSDTTLIVCDKVKLKHHLFMTILLFTQMIVITTELTAYRMLTTQ